MKTTIANDEKISREIERIIRWANSASRRERERRRESERKSKRKSKRNREQDREQDRKRETRDQDQTAKENEMKDVI
jgi:septal ring factor EnvC (AmiA/AmiB activator)